MHTNLTELKEHNIVIMKFNDIYFIKNHVTVDINITIEM